MRESARGGATRPNATGVLVVVMLFAFLLAGCPKDGAKPDPAARTDAGGAALATVSGPSAAPAAKEAGDGVHGAALLTQFECNRCHAKADGQLATQAKDCVGCHADIVDGKFNAAAASLAKWKPRVKDYVHAPSLVGLGERVTRRFVEEYLLLPVDLRPHLAQSMPRLAISSKDAKDIAAALVPRDDPATPDDPTRSPELAGADMGKGRQLLESKGCGACHAFTGVAPLAASAPPAMDPKAFAKAYALAPDLRTSRARSTASKLIAWLLDPTKVKADSAMPKIPLDRNEARDIAAYLLGAELAAPAAKPKVERLPVLTRKVTFAEVDEKVFHRSCWHCHSEPDYAIGDGGPGNSGGLGFKPRGLNLASYQGASAGMVDDHGERQSIFAKDAEGVPRLVRALLARHDEEAGGPTGAVRGMPLGYPGLAPEEIQLVETWIAQGRPK
jgi:cytochrome c551/c552